MPDATATSTVLRGPTSTYRRRLPIGAEPVDRGLAHVRVWAPSVKRVQVVVRNGLKAVPYTSNVVPETSNVGHGLKAVNVVPHTSNVGHGLQAVPLDAETGGY